MKILALSRMYPKFYDRRMGAAIQAPIGHLLRGGCDIRVISPIPFAPLPIRWLSRKWGFYAKAAYFERYDGVDVYQPRYPALPAQILVQYSGKLLYYGLRSMVVEMRKTFPFELIHAHMAMPDGYAAMLLSEKYGVPFIVTARGTDLDVTANLNPQCRAGLGRVFSKAAAVILPSEALKRKLFELFGINGVYIPNGIELKDVFSGDSPLKKEFSGRIVLLSACRLMPSKGIDLNLLAVKKLLPVRNNIVYLVIGAGEELDRLKKLSVELGIDAHVRFLGEMPNQKVMEYMSVCDVFTMPSWQETFGLVYLEAMAHGKPVIGCEGQGIDTVIQASGAGLLAKPRDVDSLVGALSRLLDNANEAVEMGGRGRAVVRERYTWARHAADTRKLYESVIHKRRAA